MSSRSATVPQHKIMQLLGVKGAFGKVVSWLFMSLLGIHKINRICKPIEHLKGIEFSEQALRRFGVTAVISQEDLDMIPKEGPFILCANHAFGSLDGLMLMSEVGKIRPDLKVLANFILSSIPALEDTFLPVNPFLDSQDKKSSHKGLRAALEHVENGGALAIFPSGEVSSDRNREHVVKDIEWQRGIMRIIKKLEVPVVPAYFHGGNSGFFHFLGRIHPSLRTVRLPRELTNKRGTVVTMKIGKPVPVSEIKAFATPEALGSYLWNRSYALEAELNNHIEENTTIVTAAEIEPHVNPDILRKELENLSDSILYKDSGFTCYLSRYDEIPNIIREIGICREETFRHIGEGTNASIDLDEYDKYYYHMHLWRDETNELVGAYRIGMGNEIIPKYGINGFYSNQFFHYSNDFSPVLQNAMELGRSFVVVESQKRPMSLNMLMKGLLCVIKRYPNLQYFFGPASITSSMPLLYRSLIVDYLTKSRGNREYSGMVRPNYPFVPNYLRLPVTKLVKADDTIEQFDRLLSRLSGGKYRIPTLVRRYVKFNCTFLAFNVDPDFNYSLDGLVLVDIRNLPEEDLAFLERGEN